MRRNPCELQIDLFCSGMRLDPSCELSRDARGLIRTRAGLGSGLEMVLAPAPPLHREVWVNVPVAESFATRSPYVLRRRDGGYEIVDDRTRETYAVRLPAEPAWYGRRTSSDQEMCRVGVLQGTYLGVYVGVSCAFWHPDTRLNCRFCTTGLNVDASMRKSVDDVVETALAAKEESGITFVHLNTGYQGGTAARLVAPYVTAVKERVGALVGVQIAPESPLAEFDHLIELGADHFSFCFEYYDPEYFRRICPGKDQVLGQEAFFRALEHCQGRLPRGACSGEIIAGNEPVESTLMAIDYITELGAFPTVCIFRPLLGSEMQDDPPPPYADMRRVMKHMWESCRDRGVPVGLAPNLEVSLIVQPADAAYLADRTWRDRWYGAKLGLLRHLAAPRFRRRMAARGP
ncbi:MAG: radical SAM protein [Planctomycetota bacterium]